MCSAHFETSDRHLKAQWLGFILRLGIVAQAKLPSIRAAQGETALSATLTRLLHIADPLKVIKSILLYSPLSPSVTSEDLIIAFMHIQKDSLTGP